MIVKDMFYSTSIVIIFNKYPAHALWNRGVLSYTVKLWSMLLLYSCCCLPTPMTHASGGSPMFPLVVHQPASPSIWPAVQSLRQGLSTNPGATMWCVCGCS